MYLDEARAMFGAEFEKKLKVCSQCLEAIESREGEQITAHIYCDDLQPCEWCSDETDELYIFI